MNTNNIPEIIQVKHTGHYSLRLETQNYFNNPSLLDKYYASEEESITSIDKQLERYERDATGLL